MQNRNDKKIKIQIVFSILLFLILVIAEFYTIINFPKEFVVIAIGAILILISTYYIINGVFSLIDSIAIQRNEKLESVIKSEKATYLLLKKNFDQIDEKIDILQETSKIPTSEIVSTQKGVAKVIINRSRENAEAIMNSNDQLLERLDEFEEKMNTNNGSLLDGQKILMTENLEGVLNKQQEILNSLKDMELRINQSIIKTQESIATQPIQVTANVAIPSGAVPVSQVVSQPVEELTSVVKEEPIIEQEPVIEPERVIEQEPIIEPEPVVEPESAVEPEPVVESEPAVESEPVIEPEPVVEPESAVEPEPVVEAKSEPVAIEVPEPEMSDPNKKMTPDEIAAMFASMSAGASEEESETLQESSSIMESEPVVEPEPAPAVAPAPDMSDPNRKMTPDEIAALIASM